MYGRLDGRVRLAGPASDVLCDRPFFNASNRGLMLRCMLPPYLRLVAPRTDQSGPIPYIRLRKIYNFSLTFHARDSPPLKLVAHMHPFQFPLYTRRINPNPQRARPPEGC